MSNLLKHAEHELALLRGKDAEPDEMQDAIEQHILAMVKLFSEEGHSGSSASYAIQILEKVLRFEPVTPLTGEDDEWNDLGYAPDMKYQNKRCGHVFKGEDGRAYDGEGIIFRDPDGSCYTGAGSRVYIEFPYRPTKKYVDRP